MFFRCPNESEARIVVGRVDAPGAADRFARHGSSPRRAPRAGALAALLLAGSVLLGCGHSEDEWQAKLAEITQLKNDLSASQAQSKKTKAELDDAQARIEQLKKQLSDAGVDIAKLNASLTEQARALEEFRKRAEQFEQIKKRFDLLREKLQSLTKFGLSVTTRNNRLVIQLPGDVLFDSGRETLRKEGQEILGKIGEVIRNDPGLSTRSFQVAGHTDNAPLKGGSYKDNWGLSVMRAREVLVYLVTPVDKNGGGLNPAKWSAAGYGDTDPVQPNDTTEHKQANRRCELVVVPNVEEVLDLKSLTQ